MKMVNMYHMRALKHIDKEFYQSIHKQPKNVKEYIVRMYFQQLGGAAPEDTITQLKAANMKMLEIINGMKSMATSLKVQPTNINTIEDAIKATSPENVCDMTSLKASIATFLSTKKRIEAMIKRIKQLNKSAFKQSKFVSATQDITTTKLPEIVDCSVFNQIDTLIKKYSNVEYLQAVNSTYVMLDNLTIPLYFLGDKTNTTETQFTAKRDLTLEKNGVCLTSRVTTPEKRFGPYDNLNLVFENNGVRLSAILLNTEQGIKETIFTMNYSIPTTEPSSIIRFIDASGINTQKNNIISAEKDTSMYSVITGYRYTKKMTKYQLNNNLIVYDFPSIIGVEQLGQQALFLSRAGAREMVWTIDSIRAIINSVTMNNNRTTSIATQIEIPNHRMQKLFATDKTLTKLVVDNMDLKNGQWQFKFGRDYKIVDMIYKTIIENLNKNNSNYINDIVEVYSSIKEVIPPNVPEGNLTVLPLISLKNCEDTSRLLMYIDKYLR